MAYGQRTSPSAKAAYRDTVAEKRRREHNDSLARERSREQNKPRKTVLKLPFNPVKSLREALSGKKKPK